MSEQSDRTPLIADAQKHARKLIRKRPWSVKPAQWANVVTSLVELASHAPNVYPSQKGIADGLGWHRSLVQRLFDIAEAHGHIERRVRECEDQWDGTEYRLMFWSSDLGVANGHGPNTETDTPVSTTSGHDPVTYDRSQPCDLPQVIAVTYDRSPNGFSNENKEPGHPSDDNTSAAPAAADSRGQRGRPQWADTCVVCGLRDIPAVDLDHGPGKVGWRCHDRVACQGRIDATAAAQADYKAKAPEREQQRERERAEAQLRRQQSEERKAAVRVAMEAHLNTLTATEVYAFGHQWYGHRSVMQHGHDDAVRTVLGYFDQYGARKWVA